MGTLQPHVDALVVTIRIGGHDVKRVLVKQGSEAKIIYPDLYIPRTAVKGQVLADFVVEFTDGVEVERRGRRAIFKFSSGGGPEGRSLAHRALTQGYWWPSMQKASQDYVRKCNQCQRYTPNIHQPGGILNPLSSPWPFAQWGLNIVGPFSRAVGNRRWLFIETDYFTKWVEAEPLAYIRDVDAKRFIWRNIITRFGGNGQAEATNKVILSGLKKKLDDVKGKWVDELLHVLWTYRTTPRRSTEETPFSMTYGTEAIIPLETGFSTLRTDQFSIDENNHLLLDSLDVVDERREVAAIKMAHYQ
ncbi:uncharacterized protein LOC142640183 [Castanea sativa]|uniref:uncharacterized protein LOC142640183 n=1 Tax=Castanea sativa TaxID=21020 RepID=UPI003F64C753